jgi:PAS domain S-box-containing protein
MKKQQDKKKTKKSDNRPRNTLLWKEEVFYQVFQSNPIPMAISRFEDAKYIDVNKAFLDFLEYKPEEVINHTSNELQLFIDIIQSDKFLSKLAKLNKVRNFEVRMTTSSGTSKNVLFSAEIIKIKDEIYLLTIYNDVTGLKKSERELKLKSAYLEQLIEQSPEAIALCNNNGYIKAINKEFTKLFGYSSKKSIGKQIDDLIAPGKRNKEASEISNNVQKGQIIALETKRRHKEGNEIDVSLLATPIIVDNRKIGQYGIYRDISERKKAEAIQRMTQNISDVVLTTDNLQELFVVIRNEISAWIDTKNFYIALYNKEKDTLSFPYFEDEKDKFDEFPAGKTLTGFVIRTNKPLLAKEAGMKKLEKEGEIELVGTSSKVWLGVPLKTDGETIGAICLQSYESEDTYTKEDLGILEFIASQAALAINKLKNEEDLKKARRVAEEAAQAKQQFLSIMSHEIRTPLNAILGMTYLLLQEDPKKEQLEFLNSLKFSGDNLMTLINDILDFNKIESGNIFFEEADFNLKDMIHGIMQSFSFRAEEKGIKLKVLIDSELPEIIVGDAARLNQVLTNLIGNAIKFTETGSITIDIIIVNTGKKKIELEFSVIDTGIGISEDSGTGLGLAICKRLIELQGRKLEVESKVGKGSKFSFTLEFKKSERKSLKPEYTREKKFDQLTGKKVLLAEDNEINTIVAQKILTRWGIDVETVTNGLEVIEKVNKQYFDVILMDLHMPEMDGFKATKIIRKSDHDKIMNIPIIALTAIVMSDVQSKIEKADFNDYVLKPFNPAECFETF